MFNHSDSSLSAIKAKIRVRIDATVGKKLSELNQERKRRFCTELHNINCRLAPTVSQQSVEEVAHMDQTVLDTVRREYDFRVYLPFSKLIPGYLFEAVVRTLHGMAEGSNLELAVHGRVAFLAFYDLSLRSNVLCLSVPSDATAEEVDSLEQLLGITLALQFGEFVQEDIDRSCLLADPEDVQALCTRFQACWKRHMEWDNRWSAMDFW